MLSARYYGRGDVRIEEVEERPLGAQEVRVQVAYCGLCGTDVQEFTRGPRFTPMADCPHPLTKVALPITLGHEISGVVSEVGAEVIGISQGDRVVVEPIICCNVCAFCLRGDYHLCTQLGFMGLSGDQGGLSESCIVDRRWVHHIGNLPLDVAALAEPMAVAHRAVHRSSVKDEESVLILGAGPIGLLSAFCARRATSGRVCVLARSKSKGELAVDLGADLVIDGIAGSAEESVMEATGGMGFDVVVECAGSAETFGLALAACRKGGTIVIAAAGPDPVVLDANLLLAKELHMVGSLGYCGDFPEAIELIAQDIDGLRRLISAHASLDQLPATLEAMSMRHRERVKVLVSPRASRDD